MVKRARELSVVAVMVLGLLAAAPTPALAGSNGQQVIGAVTQASAIGSQQYRFET